MRGERGAAAVEIALLTPLLVMLLVGGINLGLLSLQKSSTQASAQEAAVYGATLDWADPNTPVKVASVAVLAGWHRPDWAPVVCVARLGSAGNLHWHTPKPGDAGEDGTCWDDDRPGDEERVQVEVLATGELDIVLKSWSVPLTNRAVGAVPGPSPSPSPSPSESPSPTESP